VRGRGGGGWGGQGCLQSRAVTACQQSSASCSAAGPRPSRAWSTWAYAPPPGTAAIVPSFGPEATGLAAGGVPFPASSADPSAAEADWNTGSAPKRASSRSGPGRIRAKSTCAAMGGSGSCVRQDRSPAASRMMIAREGRRDGGGEGYSIAGGTLARREEVLKAVGRWVNGLGGGEFERSVQQ
jgi:hypothetical protein